MVLIDSLGRKQYPTLIKFPSPCGDYGSYQVQRRSLIPYGLSGFRPLAGIMVLIEKKVSEIKESILKLSVPLRGLWFLSLELRVLTVIGG